MILDFYVNSGLQGGYRGLSVDTERVRIIDLNELSSPITDANILPAKDCVEHNINSLNEYIANIDLKLRVTQTKCIPILDGYKLIEPPTEKKKALLLKKKNEALNKIEKIKESKLYQLLYK